MKWNTKAIGAAVTAGVLIVGTTLHADDKNKSSSSSSKPSVSSSTTTRTAPSTSTSTTTAQGLQRAQNYVDRIRLPDPPKVSTSTITPQQAIQNYKNSGPASPLIMPRKTIVVPPPPKPTEVTPSKLNPQGSRDVQRGLDQYKKKN